MPRTNKTGNFGEYQRRTQLKINVSEESKDVIKKLLEQVLSALDMSRNSLAEFLSRAHESPVRKDTTLSNLTGKRYSAVPDLGTIFQISSVIPDPENLEKSIDPRLMWGIFAGLNSYPAEFIDPNNFEIPTEKFITAVRFLAGRLERGCQSSDDAEILDPDYLADLIEAEISDREITLEDFARLVGLSPNRLKQIMSGRKVSKRDISRIAPHITTEDGEAFSSDALIAFCEKRSA